MERREPMNELQKADFTDLLRNGKLRFDACRQLDITVAQVRYAYKNDPNFRSEVDDALLEATEPVEDALYKAAKEGQPWAVKEWLTKRDKERWGEQPKELRITHELDGTELMTSVGEIYAKLEERRRAVGAIDVESFELEPAKPLGVRGNVVQPNTIIEKMRAQRKALRAELKAKGLPTTSEELLKAREAERYRQTPQTELPS